MPALFTNGTFYTGKKIRRNASLLMDHNRVEGFINEKEIPPGCEVHDLQGKNIAPAFMDLQIYGGNGFLFSAKPSFEAIDAIKEYCLKGGCSRFLLTMATNERRVFSKGIETVKQYLRLGEKNLMGLHLEGPWISPEKRGAHCLEYIHRPTAQEVKELIKEAEGVVKMITLAPEMVDEEIIDLIQTNGIIVSAGHSNATYTEASRSFDKIRTVTHLFNAMSPLQSRAPGMVGAIYDHPSVFSSIVADGIHVDYASVRISKKLLGERLFLITDAVAETLEGPYRHIFKKDRFVIPDGTLSGSALTMMAAVKNAMKHVGIGLEEALRMASFYPARVMGMDQTFGIIGKHYIPSFVVFDDDLNVLETIDYS